VIVIDEAHGVPGSKDYLKVIFSHNNVPIVALTATPFSRGMAKKHKELVGEPLFEDMVIASTIRDLIAAGMLVDCDIYAPSQPDLSGVKTKRNRFGEIDYEDKSLAEAVDKPSLIGDIVSHWLTASNGRTTVCFATNIAHSKHIVYRFQQAGVKAAHLDGYMEDDERAEIMARMDRGEITVLSNVAVLREGWDFPACEVMILARPTKSLTTWIQMCGRVLRPAPGKTKAVILDHSGSAHELGYPTDDLPLELDDGNNKPKEAKKEAKEKLPKLCPRCHFMKPAGQHKCGKCGHEPERQSDVVHAEGDLSLVERKKEKFSMDDKRGIYEALLGYAEENGIKPGWAYYKAKEITGVYPTSTTSARPGPMVEAVKNWFAHEAIKRKHGEKRAA
jgi:superfamily II DNA or RNA helicase